MADYEEEEQPTPASPLAQLQGEITDPVAKGAIGEAISHINNHLVQSQIADENAAVARNFTADWHSFGSGLTNWVQGDPTALNAALDAVEPVAHGMTTTIPGMPEEEALRHRDVITNDLQRQLAISAIRSSAEEHAQLTAGMLGNERVQKLLSEDDRHDLAAYAIHQADARSRDEYSQAIEQQKRAEQAADRRGMDYLVGLHDPQEGGPAFPPNWHRQLLADPSLPDDQKGVIADVYGKLRVRGDAAETDPFLLRDIAVDIANGQKPRSVDFAGAITGDQMRVQDALHLAALSPQEAATLFTSLRAGQDYLMGRDGENGATGARAYARYSQFLMSRYRDAGPGSLNPNAENSVFAGGEPGDLLRRFYPTGDVLLAGYERTGPSETFSGRKPLGEIFGMGKAIPGTGIIDKGVPETGETRRGRPDNPDIDPGAVRVPRGGDRAFELNGGNTYESTDRGRTGPKMPRPDEDI